MFWHSEAGPGLSWTVNLKQEEAELQSNRKIYRNNIEPRVRECQEIQWSLITNNGRVRIMEGGVSQLRGIITDNKHHFWGRRYSNNICWHSGLTLGLATGIMTNRCQFPSPHLPPLPPHISCLRASLWCLACCVTNRLFLTGRAKRRFIHYNNKILYKNFSSKREKLSTIQLWSFVEIIWQWQQRQPALLAVDRDKPLITLTITWIVELLGPYWHPWNLVIFAGGVEWIPQRAGWWPPAHVILLTASVRCSFLNLGD